MEHRLLIAAAILLTSVPCPAAEPNASLLFFFSPETTIEFIGFQRQPKRHDLGKEVMLQITQTYPKGTLLRGGERVFDLRIKALTDGNITAFAFENQRLEDGKLQGFYPAALEELNVDERDLLKGKTVVSGAVSRRLQNSRVQLKAGREYRVQAKIGLASEHERQLGLAASAVQPDATTVYSNIELWSNRNGSLQYQSSQPTFMKVNSSGLKGDANYLLLNGRNRFPAGAEQLQVTVKIRALEDCDIRAKFCVSGKIFDERGIRRQRNFDAELASFTVDGVELLKEPVPGNWYTWAGAATAKLVTGREYELGFIIRTKLPKIPDPAETPRLEADFSLPAEAERPLHPVFGINDLRSPLITDATAKRRAESDRRAGYLLRRLSNLDVVFGGRRAGDPFRIFGVFDADANDPANYYFKATDDFLSIAKESDIPIVYSLAPTVEYSQTHYRTGEPDRIQFARVCNNIIRHYNEKWANGFTHDIKRWEIWNEPDSSDYWSGDVASFGRFYAAVASALKKESPALEFGGPSFSEWNEKNFRAFLAACREAKAPLDFFTFKCNGPNPAAFAREVRAAKRLLDEYGYSATPVIVSEYNYNPLDKTVWTRNDPAKLAFLDEHQAGVSGSDAGAAAILATILWQETPLECACIYGFGRHRLLRAYSSEDLYTTGRGGVSAVLPLYSEFFNHAAADQRAHTVTASEHLGILAAAGRNGDGLLLITALRDPGRKLELRLKGVADGTAAKVRLWPSLERRPAVNGTRPAYRWDDETVFVRDGVMKLPKYHDSMVFLIRLPKSALNAEHASAGDSLGPAPAEPVASVDFACDNGKFKRLHGVNIAIPMEFEGDATRRGDLGAIGFDTVRVHDLRGEDANAGMSGDYQNIFPNYHADPAVPRNYNFAPTDAFMRMVRESSPRTGFVFGLAPTIENSAPIPNKYWVIDPGNYDRFADLCAGIVRHYDRGWADGFKYNIGYYEIWNEPDSIDMWNKSYGEYCRFYATVAKRIKAACPWIKIGGPAITKPKLKDLTLLADICREKDAPLDFVSWHLYTDSLDEMLSPVPKIRQMLDEHGFKHTELQFNEWRFLPFDFAEIRGDDPAYRMLDEGRTGRHGADSAAFIVTALARMQDTAIDMSNYYSYGNGQWGLYDKNGGRRLPWYAHKLYADFVRACERRVATSDPGGDQVAVLGGVAKNATKYLLVSAFGEPARTIGIKLAGVSVAGGLKVTRLDSLRKLETFADCYENGVLKLEKDAGGAVFLVEFE